MIADELPRQADVFTDLTQPYNPSSDADPSERPAPREPRDLVSTRRNFLQRATTTSMAPKGR